MPVVDEDDNLVGMASVSDLAKAYFQEITLDSVSASGASIIDIEKVIEANVLVKGDDTAKITGDIKVIASCIERAASTIKAGEIVIIGNRPEECLRQMYRPRRFLHDYHERALKFPLKSSLKRRRKM